MNKKYYVISNEEVGCNSNGIENVEVFIQTNPGITNQSKLPKISGWLGTYCKANGDATASHAHGEFDSIESAEKYVNENFDVVETELELGNDDVIKRFITPETVVWDADEYFQDSFEGYLSEYAESKDAVEINADNLQNLIDWFESQVEDEIDGYRLRITGIDDYVKRNFQD